MNSFKKIFSFNCLFLACALALAKPLFTKDGKLSEGCISLCNALKINEQISSPEEFNEYFQEHFLRQKGKECYENFDAKTGYDLASVLEACKVLGMIGDVRPKRNFYNYILILGSDTETMKKKCLFLRDDLKVISEKNPLAKIYFLTGARKLNDSIDSREIIKTLSEQKLPLTETNAAKLIWEKIFKGSRLRCKFIDVEAQAESRPTTADTVNRLLDRSKCKSGAMLAISMNPFISYQDNILRNILAMRRAWFNSGGSLETVGYGADINSYRSRFGEDFVINVILSNVAKCAFEEMKLLKAEK